MTTQAWHHEIGARLEAVQSRIARACEAAGREPEDVRLIAVSKRKPSIAIRAAYDLGLRDFGENYAQELRDKADELQDLSDIRWHFIGPLQRNKARLVVGRAQWIHTVDRAAIINTLNQRAATANAPLDILIQLNLAGEISKSGAQEADLPKLLDLVHSSSLIRCRGLMAITPALDDPQDVAPHFNRLRNILATCHDAQGEPLRELSMGMSADLEVAIAAGATMIRIGSAIFGPRL